MRNRALSIVFVLASLACAGGEIADDGARAGASGVDGGATGAGGANGGAGASAAGSGSAAGNAALGGAGGGGGASGSASGAGGGGGTVEAGTGGALGAAGSGGAGSAGASGSGSGGSNHAGTSGTSGGAGSGGCDLTWPTANGNENVDGTIEVDDVFDGEMKRFVGTGSLGTTGGSEDQGAIFRLARGAVLRNVILGNPAADGIHCQGSCSLDNVWWEDVGEDAATLEGDDDSQTMLIECGGARRAEDKVFQHNGPGTMIIRNFTVEDFGKLYRSCGNCDDQYTRHALFEDITARGGNSIAGVNENYGDTAEFHRIVIYGSEASTPVCVRWRGNDTGAEPVTLGEGPDAEHCLYDESDIEYR